MHMPHTITRMIDFFMHGSFHTRHPHLSPRGPAVGADLNSPPIYGGGYEGSAGGHRETRPRSLDGCGLHRVG